MVWKRQQWEDVLRSLWHLESENEQPLLGKTCRSTGFREGLAGGGGRAGWKLQRTLFPTDWFSAGGGHSLHILYLAFSSFSLFPFLLFSCSSLPLSLPSLSQDAKTMACWSGCEQDLGFIRERRAFWKQSPSIWLQDGLCLCGHHSYFLLHDDWKLHPGYSGCQDKDARVEKEEPSDTGNSYLCLWPSGNPSTLKH